MGAVCEVSAGLPRGHVQGLPTSPKPSARLPPTHSRPRGLSWHSAHTFSPLLSLQQEHVRVLGASVHIFPDSLQKEQEAMRRPRATPRHARPLKLAVPGPVEATREPSLRSASKSETRQAPSKPIHTEPSAQGGWAGTGTSPVVTRPPSASSSRALHPHHLRISGLKLWSKDRMKLCRRPHGRSKALLSSQQHRLPHTRLTAQSDTWLSRAHPVCTLHLPAGHRCRDGNLADWLSRRLQLLGAPAFASRSLSFKLLIFNRLLTSEYFYVYRKPELYFYVYRKLCKLARRVPMCPALFPFLLIP